MPQTGRILAFLAFLTLPLGLVVALGERDSRSVIGLPGEAQGPFRAEMKTHMVSLKDLTRAMAEGDYREAARVAEARVDFGHAMWTAMANAGVPEPRVSRLRAALEERSDRGLLGPEGGAAGGTLALPMDFRVMGRNLKEAAHRFSLVARTVDSPANAQGSAAVNRAYQDMVAACQACHDSYRFPRTNE
jgi:hypothetical protein